ncbi:hypothetical protein OIU85_019872, partial [Salix viminalis]
MDRLHGPAGPSNVTCVLCNREPETHCHLFFNCSFSKQVWEAVNFKARIQWPGLPWDQLTIWAGNNLTKKSQINCQIARLVLAASVYHMWQERNRRVFSNQRQGRGYMTEEIFQELVGGGALDLGLLLLGVRFRSFLASSLFVFDWAVPSVGLFCFK